jgi:hypothetical protein
VLLLLSSLFSVVLLASPSLTTELPDDFFVQLQSQHQTNIKHRERVSLINFFDHYHGKKPYPITAYLTYADQYQIDYRLLPAISVAESSAGNHACGDNWFGWQSCKGYNFGSVAQGIQLITEQLACGSYYQGKTLVQKLHSYNPNPSYAPKIIGFMKEIK